MAKGQIKQKQDRISEKQFESLCAIQCTQEEICGVLGCNTDTLLSWCRNTYGKDFSEVFAEKRQLGRMSLRRNMFRQSETNPTMAIWLSKQHLGMRDNIEIESKQLIKVEELLNKIEEEANK